MIKRDKKPYLEREQTDESLRRERTSTDEALAAKRRRAEDLADGVMERARGRADEVLAKARKKADGKLDPDGSSADEDTIMLERGEEDEALKQERGAADETVRCEREEESRALAALLPLEREKTDRYLWTERVFSDEALAHRDDFLGMVSHDLRNLLDGIAMNVKLLATPAWRTDEDFQPLVHTERMDRYIARMNRLIGDLVDVTSIETGKLAVRPHPGDIAELISEAVVPFSMAAEEKGVSLECKPRRQVLPAVFDRDRMQQVLTNLIANAIRFTPPGGSVTLEATRMGGELRITVSDTGEGIAEEMREAIFERFRQGGASDHGGLGLGLFISKCIVEAQGGRIWAESNPAGVGTSFHLTIPAAGEAGA